ncbi:lysozyme [Rodentibacter pneumotropicus]|uniref:Lysozyme n=1 Tax=Rodentibacter pneumotropicus TaxID=758 RepID=A0A448MPZ8_9PAST|nr:lysozyme [Rodentibacter pneumotropicus]VEH67254.1 lysozyme [Rodentibacter pneumotropicus]
MSEMTISLQGIQALKGHEALRLEAYDDGTGVWTIGYGHTGKVNGVPVGPGMTITEEQAEALLKERLVEFENAVHSSVKVPLTQNQYDALVSLAYNIGARNFKTSTLVKKLNKGDIEGAAEQFGVWRKAGGKVMQGLINRRNKEREMFLGGQKVDAPMPENQFPLYGNLNVEPKPLSQPSIPVNLGEQLAGVFTPPTVTTNNGFENYFNSMNSEFEKLDQFEPEQAKISNRQKYQKQLADAFGIAPQVGNGFPDYIGDMVRSIYDQTA